MDGALVLCRVLHYGSALLVFGVGAFQGWLAPPVLANSLDAALWRIVRLAAVVAFLSALAWLFLASGEMGDGWSDVWNPATWYAVLADTEFGHVWQFHLLLAAVLAGLVLSRPGGHWRLLSILAAFYLGGLGFIGHAVMLDGSEGWISRASHVVHLLAGGFWLGALAPLSLCLGKLGDAELRPDISYALRRFSGLGHIAVAAVIASGIVNVALVLGQWPTDTSSPYQALLLCKVALVAAMIGFAIVNRYVLVPKIRNGGAALRGLRFCTLAELVLGFCVVALVSLFGTLPPQ
ncbi:copper homeostasis membrane protein CopD [Mesorhizobium sp. M0895]|uniref:copper homeostasis membrane protein CopD n=1 Tax=Mesorhizobium sp. M0895 TaxID=2957019 RepID=UPI003335A3F8